jgi:hypothetical protein
VTQVLVGDLTLHGLTRTRAIPAHLVITDDLVALRFAIEFRRSEFAMEKAARKTVSRAGSTCELNARTFAQTITQRLFKTTRDKTWRN